MPSDGGADNTRLEAISHRCAGLRTPVFVQQCALPCLILAPVNQTQMFNTKTDGLGYIGSPAAKTENRRTPQVECATSALEDSDQFASQPSNTVLWQAAFQPRECGHTGSSVRR